jgi:hypothetical protein
VVSLEENTLPVVVLCPLRLLFLHLFLRVSAAPIICEMGVSPSDKRQLYNVGLEGFLSQGSPSPGDSLRTTSSAEFVCSLPRRGRSANYGTV